MSRLSDYFADYVPSLYIGFGYCYGHTEDGSDGTIRDVVKELGVKFSSDTLIEIFEKIQKENIGIEWNKAVGLTIKEALQNQLDGEITSIYVSDEMTGEIFIDKM